MACCGSRICNSNAYDPGQDSFCILLSKSTALSNSLKESEENPTVPRAPKDNSMKFI